MVELICRIALLFLDLFVKDQAKKEAWAKGVVDRVRELDKYKGVAQKQYDDYQNAQEELKKRLENGK